MVKVIINNLEDAIAYFEDEHLIWIEDLEYTKNDDEEDELYSTCYGKPQGEILEEVIELVQMAFRDERVIYLIIDTALTTEEYELIKKHRDGYLGVYWSIADFELSAQNVEEGEVLYDRTKFPEALESMIRKHDCEFGITWEHVRYWLNTYCKLKQEDEESI